MRSCIESEHDLVRFLVAPMSEPTPLADDEKTALRRHTNRRGVVSRSASVKRTGCLQLQELLSGTGGDAAAPIFTANPIGDLAATLQIEARNLTHDSTVDLDDPVRRRHVAPQPRPPSLEGGSIILIRRSERGHPYRVGIRPVLEQHVEITSSISRRTSCPEPSRTALTLTARTQITPDCPRAGIGGKQLPVPLGDDLDGVVDHFDGGLVVNRVRRTWDPDAHRSAPAMELPGMPG